MHPEGGQVSWFVNPGVKARVQSTGVGKETMARQKPEAKLRWKRRRFSASSRKSSCM